MTKINKLARKTRVILGQSGSEPDETELITILLENAAQWILGYLARDDWKELPDSLDWCVQTLAIQSYNRRGAEGAASVSEGGVSQSYQDLPESIQRALNRYRVAKAVKMS